MAGRNCRIINSGNTFDLYADDYFEFIKAEENKIDVNGYKKLKPATMQGFAVFVGMSYNTLYAYKKSKDDGIKEGFARLHNRVAAHQLEHGLLGNYNGTLVSRVLGLAEKVEADHKSSDGSMSPTFVFKPVGSDD